MIHKATFWGNADSENVHSLQNGCVQQGFKYLCYHLGHLLLVKCPAPQVLQIFKTQFEKSHLEMYANYSHINVAIVGSSIS